MNTRERFLALMDFEPVDRSLLWEMGYWGGTVRRWYREGLPRNMGVPDTLPDGSSVKGEDLPVEPLACDPLDHPERDADVHRYFGMDEPTWRVPLNCYVCPQYEKEVVEDHGDWVVHRNEYGVLVKDRKDRAGFPHWIRTPVGCRDDWERLKAERLRPTLDGRLPKNWERFKEAFRRRTFPLVLAGYPCGFYGTARFLLGEERVMTEFYDDPELMRDIINYLADFWSSLYDQVLGQIDVDGILIWEDMCYKSGPLISPKTFREFILPGYQKLTGCLRSHGVRTVMVDTDGHCSALLPLLVEGGVTAVGPFEQAAGMDIAKVRRDFPRLGIVGGIDKTKLKLGPAAIDRELEKVPAMLAQGGFIPHVDHQVPPDVSWADFQYYRERLNDMIRRTPVRQP
jgi:hypothetical protein